MEQIDNIYNEKVTKSEVDRIRSRLENLREGACKLTGGTYGEHESVTPDYSDSPNITVSLSEDKPKDGKSKDDLLKIVLDEKQNKNHVSSTYTFEVLYMQNEDILMKAVREGVIDNWLPGGKEDYDFGATIFVFTPNSASYKSPSNHLHQKPLPLDRKGRHLLRTALSQMEGAVNKCHTRLDVKTSRGTIDERGDYQ